MDSSAVVEHMFEYVRTEDHVECLVWKAEIGYVHALCRIVSIEIAKDVVEVVQPTKLALDAGLRSNVKHLQFAVVQVRRTTKEQDVAAMALEAHAPRTEHFLRTVVHVVYLEQLTEPPTTDRAFDSTADEKQGPRVPPRLAQSAP